MKIRIYIFVLLLSAMGKLMAQNGMSGAINIGNIASAFSYTDTKNTADYGNNYTARTPNDVYYKFTLTYKMDLVISHCGSVLNDTYLTLLNASGGYVTSNDDFSGAGHCSNVLLSYVKASNLAPGTYYIVSEGYNQSGSITTSIQATESVIPVDQVGSQDQNYTVRRTYTSEDAATFQDVVLYFDGLGRPVETVQKRVTPNHNDLVAYQEYDNFGRETNSWLPRPANVNDGKFIEFGNFGNLSNTEYQNDAHPYSKTAYELSPLNRIKEQYGAGVAWHNGGKALKTEYLSNESSGDFVCRWYSVAGTGLSTTIVYNGNYDIKELFVAKTTDEDGNVSYEFKNKLNQVLLKRQKNNSESIDTYYVYDDYGNLCYVLQPLAGAVTTGSDSRASMKYYAFVYKYDNRNRCIYKRLPSNDPVYFIYDKADHMIFSQDGEQRLQNKWYFSLPDVFGRTAVTGLCSNSLNYAASPLDNNLVTVTRSNTTDALKGYTISGVALTSAKVLTVNYYDDYAFVGKNEVPDNADFQYETMDGYGKRYANAKGLLTGTLVAGGTDFGTMYPAIFYYDEKGRTIQSKSKASTGGYNKEYFSFNFTGQPVKKKSVFSKTGSGTDLITEEYTYNYDHAGRVTETRHKLNGGTEVILEANTYDELGRLKTTKANNKSYLQQTYDYNLRGWLTKIDGSRFKEEIYYQDVVTTPFESSTPCWNGNISAVRYDNMLKFTYNYDQLSRLKRANSFIENMVHYGDYSSAYTYDANGNMTGMSRVEDLMAESLTFGHQGNRMYNVVYADDDDYAAGGASFDFMNDNNPQDYHNAFIDYSHGNIQLSFSYNRNGSMVTDPYKGATYTYNLLGMPSTASILAVNGTINYKYDAEGNKQEVSYAWHNGLSLDPLENIGKNYAGTNSSKTVQYAENKIYEDGALSKILLPNGYISGGIYYFYIQDHLGNNTVVVHQNGLAVMQRTYYHPFGKPIGNGESTGEAFQPYKFGGKEQQTMLGLTQYDFSARTLDYSYNRFTSVDPLAEKYYSNSPYIYCAGNPINCIDPDGMDWFQNNKTGDVIFLSNLHFGAEKDMEDGWEWMGGNDMFMSDMYDFKNSGNKLAANNGGDTHLIVNNPLTSNDDQLEFSLYLTGDKATKFMQRQGYDFKPTQQIRYESEITYYPPSGANVVTGEKTYITEKSGYVPKGAIEDEYTPLSNLLYKGNVTVNRFQISYTTNIIKKGFNSLMPFIGYHDQRIPKVYPSLSAYPWNNKYINQFLKTRK